MPSIGQSSYFEELNKSLWVAHFLPDRLYHMKLIHTIRGRATKPVFPKQRRNEYPQALLSSVQYPLRAVRSYLQSSGHLRSSVSTLFMGTEHLTQCLVDDGAGNCFSCYQLSCSGGRLTVLMRCNRTPPPSAVNSAPKLIPKYYTRPLNSVPSSLLYPLSL